MGELEKPTSNHSPCFLRWAGSKKQLLPLLSRYWRANHTRYVEPFAGSACLFFRLRPRKAILGDINRELIHTYLEVKYRASSVVDVLGDFNTGRREYLRIRSMDPSSLDSASRAARFIFLNRFCFNGLYRTNRAGVFNVPYGGEKSGHLPSAAQLFDCSKALKNAQLVAGDFERILCRVEEGDFVYLDPPFAVEARRVFNEYDAASFNVEDVKRLRRWMDTLARKDVSFLVSYAQSEEGGYLSQGFFTEIATVKRNIAGFTQRRAHARELLISNVRPG